MEYRVAYQKENLLQSPLNGHIILDGEIGSRFDRFVHERVSGKFAIDEILKEAEECIRDKYDDEYCLGLWRCEFWGKLILSAARICRLKKDDALKEEIRKSVYRVLAYQDETGYLGSYQDRTNIFQADSEQCLLEVGSSFGYNWNVWGQKYTLWALLECAQLLDDPHILDCCCRLADQLIALLEKLNVRLKDAGVMHGMPAGSILKPMLILYRLTGNSSYLTFCTAAVKEWEREDGECPNLIANALAGRSPATWYSLGATTLEGWIAKAYEMMSCFDGILEYYRISGDPHYLKAVETFWEVVLEKEENILGSVGFCERFANAADYADAATEICDVIHWMRLSYELFCLTGKARYMDAFEKAYLNAFLAGLYEDGRTCAFFVRGAGRHLIADWQVETKYQHCCLNNLGRGFVNAADATVTTAGGDYYINLYTQTRIRFGEVSFRIGTGYIDQGQVAITVRGAAAGSKLHLRLPQWSAQTTIRVVGGETVETPQRGTYYTLTLTGDDQVIRLAFDMTPEVLDFSGTFRTDLPADDYHIARWHDDCGGLCGREQMLTHPMSVIRRGPLMLARSMRVGAKPEEMFSGKTVFGKERTVSAQTIRHDGLLTLCRVTFSCEGEQYDYIMCDYASAANCPTEEVRYFTMYV